MDVLLGKGTREERPGPAAHEAAPELMVIGRDGMVADGAHLAAFLVERLPRHTYAGWLSELVDSGHPLTLAVHAEPLPQGVALRRLERRLVEHASGRLYEMRTGRLASAERAVAYDDLERMRDALVRGEERVFRTGIYLLLRGRSAAELEQAAGAIRRLVEGKLARLRRARYRQRQALISCLPLGRDWLGARQHLDTSSLAFLVPFASAQLPPGDGIFYGVTIEGGAPVVLDPFSPWLPNANKAIFATSGAGKSYLAKVEALRCLLRDIHYYIIDPEGEYRRLADAVGGVVVRPGAQGVTINPFDLPERPLDEGGDLLAEKVASLAGLLAVMLFRPDESPTGAEMAALEEAVWEAYRRKGITRETASRPPPPPTLVDLLAVMEEQGRAPGLALRLQRYTSGSLARFFAGETTVDLGRPFVAFDVRDVEQEARPVVFYLVTDHIWREVRRHPRPRIVVIDEAWTLLQHESGAAFVEALARRARKYYLGLTVISQDVEDVLGSRQGRVVLRNSAVHVLLRQDPSARAVVREAFRLSEREWTFLVSCRPGQGIFLLGRERVPVQVVASPMEHRICTTDPRELMREVTG